MGDHTEMSLSHSLNADMSEKIAQTLVFFDLETTGLPCSIYKKNVQITELSLIAVDRKEFENSENARVLNKLSLTIKPRSNISIEAIHLTGLCNTSLQYQEHFSLLTAQLLQFFCQRLNQPVCLLAHNGRRFDFPILQAELKNIGAKLSDTIYCADTLEAFRQIFLAQDSFETDNAINKANEASSVCYAETSLLSTKGLDESTHLTPAKGTSHIATCAQYYDVDMLTSDHIDKFLCQEMGIFENLVPKDESTNSSSSAHLVTSTTSDCHFGGHENVDELFGPHNSQHDEKTPLSKTVSIPIRARKCKILSSEQIAPAKDEKNYSSTRRRLFNEEMVSNGQSTAHNNIRKNRKTRMSFSLKNLYRHFFMCDIPCAHFAEGDCLALMKVCRELKGFLPWVDEHMIVFDNVQPLW